MKKVILGLILIASLAHADTDPIFSSTVRSRDDGADERVHSKIVGNRSSAIPGATAQSQVIVNGDGSLNVTVTASSIPSGAATEAKQDVGNAYLFSLTGYTDEIESKLDTGNFNTSSINSKIPAGLTVSASRLLVNADGSNVNASQDGVWTTGRTWNLNASTDYVGSTQAGPWVIGVGSSALPTGAATEATLSTRASEFTVNSLNSKVPAGLTVSASRLLVDSSGSTTIVNQGTNPWVVNVNSSVLPTGAATSANQTSQIALETSIDGKLNTLGQKPMTGSAPVVLASDQSAIPTSRTWNLNASTDYVGAAQAGPWVVSVGASVLPTGSATSALQGLGLNKLDGVNANLVTATATLNSIDNGIPVSLGQTTMAGSMPVVFASDQNITVTPVKVFLTASSGTFATVGLASAQAVAANLNRGGLILTNTSAAIIYIEIGVTAVVGSGIPIYPGGSWTMDAYNYTSAAINAIATLASSNLAIQEFTK